MEINGKDVHDLATYAIQQMPQGVKLGEFKYMDVVEQSINTRNEIVTNLGSSRNQGFGIRILKDGAWGFSASNELTKTVIDKSIKLAIKLANAAARCQPNIKVTEEPVVEATVSTNFAIDPFTVELSEKLEYLLEIYAVTKKYSEIKFTNSGYRAQKDHMIFYNTDGTKIDQSIIWNGGLTYLVAVGNGDTQTRKFPDDQFQTLGYEHFKDQNIAERVDEVAVELVKLLEAPRMKEQRSTIILNPTQLGIQLHESMGHPSELDRAIGYEAGYAGTSFLKTELLGQNYRYGNDLVTIHADATIPGGLGSFPYDHEGVAGKNTVLVEKGTFTGYLSSRETAPVIGLENSGGTTRSFGFDKIP
ncbi:MAG: TldD/PmbA family protein [Candidatus Heimdallarchaeota archaeon]|nr:TldD/PmbA family protein [Candidatus Heimdallarchaeota archaeon]